MLIVVAEQGLHVCNFLVGTSKSCSAFSLTLSLPDSTTLPFLFVIAKKSGSYSTLVHASVCILLRHSILTSNALARFKNIPISGTTKLVISLVHSHINYCNSVLAFLNLPSIVSNMFKTMLPISFSVIIKLITPLLSLLHSTDSQYSI